MPSASLHRWKLSATAYFTKRFGAVKAGGDWEVLATNELGDECYATPAIGGGRIYIRSQGGLHCFGEQAAEDRQKRWSRNQDAG